MRAGPLVVVGDVLLDVDLDGTAGRLSPDAPVPVVDGVRERARAGGAGLAACCAAGFAGREVVLVAPLGADRHADRLRGLLAGRVRLVELPLRGETVRKTRIRAGGQSLVRVDEGDGRAAGDPVPAPVAGLLAGAGAVLVSDYGRGTAAHPGVRELVEGLPPAVPLVWDPHPRGAEPVPGARLVTPNRAEAAERAAALRGAPGGPADDALALVRHWRAAGVAVTLGAEGALVSVGDEVPFMAPVPEPVAGGGDPCGAGDCFSAAAAAALADGELLPDAVVTAVGRAAEFVSGGHPAADRAAVPDAWETVRRTRARGGRVVATGGCFDLLHAGHVSLLREARRLGDCLVVCLNSDASVRELKGPGRPVVPGHDRARVLAALDAVDAVAVFDELTPVELLRRLRPDVWVKGADYSAAELAEADVVREGGGEVVLLPCLEGRSTSALVERALSAAGGGR